MKRLITLLIFASLGLNLFSQTTQGYYLEKFQNTNNGRAITSLFVLGDKIWGSTYGVSGGGYQAVYFDGANWNYPQQPVDQSIENLSGFKKNDNSVFLIHSWSTRLYVWNNSINNFDLLTMPFSGSNSRFILTEDNVYMGAKSYEDGKSRLYHWNGSSVFTLIAERNNVYFSDIYAKNQNNVLVLSWAISNNSIVENNLLRYDGSQLVSIYSFGNDYNAGTVKEICSNDGNIFFVINFGGDVYRWDDTNQQGSKVYSFPTEDYSLFSNGIVVKDNDNIFVYGSGGVKHIKISTGETKKLKHYYDDEYGWVEAGNVRSGFYDKYNDKAYFGRNDSQIFILKFDTGSGINDVDLSNKLSVYPNPTVNNLTIDFPLSGRKTGAVYNVIGSRLMAFDIVDGNNLNLDVSSLPKGVYILNLETSEGRASKKFIKK